MASHRILTSDDVRAIGGDLEAMAPIETGERTAILPMALTDGTYTLAVVALESAMPQQRNYIEANCAARAVTFDEFRWVAEAEAEAAMVQQKGSE